MNALTGADMVTEHVRINTNFRLLACDIGNLQSVFATGCSLLACSVADNLSASFASWAAVALGGGAAVPSFMRDLVFGGGRGRARVAPGFKVASAFRLAVGSLIVHCESQLQHDPRATSQLRQTGAQDDDIDKIGQAT